MPDRRTSERINSPKSSACSIPSIRFPGTACPKYPAVWMKNVEIPGNISDWFFFQPLPNDYLDILIR